jgi:hypothetical protein
LQKNTNLIFIRIREEFKDFIKVRIAGVWTILSPTQWNNEPYVIHRSEESLVTILRVTGVKTPLLFARITVVGTDRLFLGVSD